MRPLSGSPDARISDADRDRVAGRLTDACAEGRLSLETFVDRLDVLFAARTDHEARALLADLPTPGSALARLASWATALARVSDRPTAQRVLVPADGGVVGRSPGCHCLLADDTVSRRHATLTPTDTGWKLRDLGSSNGTYVNGVRVLDAYVRPGDDVWFGLARVRLVRASR